MKSERMWTEHAEYVKHFLVALTHDIDLADDLLQETYLRAQARIPNYRGEGAPGRSVSRTERGEKD